MSNEAGLTDQERAILATLAEKASADDPALAAALRGSGRRRRALARPAFTSHWVAGVVLAVVGLVATLVSLSVGIVLGAVGLVLLVAGTGIVVADRARLRHARATITEQVGSGRSDRTA